MVNAWSDISVFMAGVPPFASWLFRQSQLYVKIRTIMARYKRPFVFRPCSARVGRPLAIRCSHRISAIFPGACVARRVPGILQKYCLRIHRKTDTLPRRLESSPHRMGTFSSLDPQTRGRTCHLSVQAAQKLHAAGPPPEWVY